MAETKVKDSGSGAAGEQQKIVLFCCENSGYKALETVWDNDIFDGTKVIPLPCSGKLERHHILKSLENGYNGVLILACPKDNCTYLRGSYRAEKRVEMIREAVGKVGIGKDRIRIGFVSSMDGHKCIELVRRMKAGLAGGTENLPGGKTGRETKEKVETT